MGKLKIYLALITITLLVLPLSSAKAEEKTTDPLLEEWYDIIGFRFTPDLEWEKQWVGKKIDKTNVDQVKDLLPQIAYLAFKNWDNVYAYVEPATTNWRPSPGFIQATKENLGKVTVDAEWPYILHDYVAGCPFPKHDNDPVKIAWNRDRGVYESDDFQYASVVFNVFDHKGRGRTVGADYNRLYWAYRTDLDPKPELPGNRSGIYRTTSLRVYWPFDINGINQLVTKYKDTHKREDVYLYVPTMRRVRRLSAAQRCDSLAGTDAAWDDADLYDGEVSQNDYNFIGIQDKLIWYDVEYPYPDTANWDGAYLSGLPFQKRPMIVMEANSNIPNFCYSKRIWYIDPVSFRHYNSTLFDRKGRLWKEQYIACSKSMKNPDNPENNPTAMTQFIDWQAQHASPWHYEPPEKGKKTGLFVNSGWDPILFTAEGIRRMGR
jgi:hypothetical protein